MDPSNQFEKSPSLSYTPEQRIANARNYLADPPADATEEDLARVRAMLPEASAEQQVATAEPVTAVTEVAAETTTEPTTTTDGESEEPSEPTLGSGRRFMRKLNHQLSTVRVRTLEAIAADAGAHALGDREVVRICDIARTTAAIYERAMRETPTPLTSDGDIYEDEPSATTRTNGRNGGDFVIVGHEELRATLQVLGTIRDPRFEDMLIELTRNANRNVRVAAMEQLRQRDSEKGLEQMFEIIKTEEDQVVLQMAASMIRVSYDPEKYAAQYGRVVQTEKNSTALAIAINALGIVADPAYSSLVLKHVDSPDYAVATAAIQTLGFMGEAEAIDPICKALVENRYTMSRAVYTSLINLAQFVPSERGRIVQAILPVLDNEDASPFRVKETIRLLAKIDDGGGAITKVRQKFDLITTDDYYEDPDTMEIVNAACEYLELHSTEDDVSRLITGMRFLSSGSLDAAVRGVMRVDTDKAHIAMHDFARDYLLALKGFPQKESTIGITYFNYALLDAIVDELQKTKNPIYIPLLTDIAADSAMNFPLAKKAVEVLVSYNTPDAAKALIEALDSERKDKDVYSPDEIVWAMASFTDPIALTIVKPFVKDIVDDEIKYREDLGARGYQAGGVMYPYSIASAVKLGMMEYNQRLEELINVDLLRNRRSVLPVIEAALDAKMTSSYSNVQRILNHPLTPPEIRRKGLEAIGRNADPEMLNFLISARLGRIPSLRNLLNDEFVELSLLGISSIPTRDALVFVITESQKPGAGKSEIVALANTKSPYAVIHLENMYHRVGTGDKREVLKALYSLGSEDAIRAIDRQMISETSYPIKRDGRFIMNGQELPHLQHA